MTIRAPEIVNGLQTSHEIFNYFSQNKKSDDRTVLVRVIIPPDEQTRDKITAATNSQTPVNLLSLHATEHIHYEIEDLLRLYNIFYDRKKGKYRRLKKPLSQIVSMKYIAQAVMSIIAEYLQNKSGLESDVIADVRYYVDAVVASIMAKQAHPTADQVAKLAVLVKTPIDVGLLENATKLVPCLSG